MFGGGGGVGGREVRWIHFEVPGTGAAIIGISI